MTRMQIRRLPGPRPALRGVCAVLLAALVGAPPSLARGDVVLFKNGDRLTGEIKGLDRGKVSFDAAATGVINLEWDDIDKLVSATTFELILENGEKIYGTLATPTTAGQVRVQSDAQTHDLPLSRVVRMTPIKSTLRDRIEMSIDAGYSLAKANSLEQTNFGYDLRYRDERRQTAFNADASVSNSESEPGSTRVFMNFAYRRFLDGMWDPYGIGQLERNDELGIDRRQTAGGGMSRWLRDTNSSRIAFSGGLALSTEDDFGSAETKTDTEAVVGVDAEWFRYDEPELDVSMQLMLFQRLSGSKEPRGNLDLNFRWEILKDFFWGLSVYYTFDRQSDTSEPTTDYGTFMSLGWKF